MLCKMRSDLFKASNYRLIKSLVREAVLQNELERMKRGSPLYKIFAQVVIKTSK